jgi:hypothetical protein
MNKKIASLLAITAFTLGSLGSINTAPVKKVTHKNVVAVSNPISHTPNMSISLSGRCALANNKEEYCSGGKGTTCDDDEDCCGRTTCSIPAGKNSGTCQ